MYLLVFIWPFPIHGVGESRGEKPERAVCSKYLKWFFTHSISSVTKLFALSSWIIYREGFWNIHLPAHSSPRYASVWPTPSASSSLSLNLTSSSLFNIYIYILLKSSLVAQMVKQNLSAIQETWVLSLGQEDPLEKGMATHSAILPWEFHGQRSLSGYSLRGSQRVRHDWVTNTHT